MQRAERIFKPQTISTFTQRDKRCLHPHPQNKPPHFGKLRDSPGLEGRGLLQAAWRLTVGQALGQRLGMPFLNS